MAIGFTICCVVVILVSDDFGHEGACPVALQHVSEISERLYGFLIQ